MLRDENCLVITYQIPSSAYSTRKVVVSKFRFIVFLAGCFALGLSGVIQIADKAVENADHIHDLFQQAIVTSTNYLLSVTVDSPKNANIANISIDEFKTLEMDELDDIRELRHTLDVPLTTNSAETTRSPVEIAHPDTENVSETALNKDALDSQNHSTKEGAIENSSSKSAVEKSEEKRGAESAGEKLNADQVPLAKTTSSAFGEDILIELKKIEKVNSKYSVILSLTNPVKSTSTKGQYFTMLKSYSLNKNQPPEYFTFTKKGIDRFLSLKRATMNSMRNIIEIPGNKKKILKIDFNSSVSPDVNIILYLIYKPENAPVVAKSFLVQSAKQLAQ